MVGHVNRQHSKIPFRVKGLFDQKQYMSFCYPTVLIPENVYGRPKKREMGLAAGCQLFYRKIYGYFFKTGTRRLTSRYQ